MSRLLSDLLPQVSKLAELLISKSADAGWHLAITQTFRTFAEQDALYQQGRTTPGAIVTEARGGQSWHNFRRAFDVAFVVEGRITWDGPWEQLGALAESIGLEWGGRWHKPDRPHFQLIEGTTLAEARRENSHERISDTSPA